MAIHPWGIIFVSQGKTSTTDAEQAALDECNNNQKTRNNGRDGGCFLYASNNEVIISKRLMSPVAAPEKSPTPSQASNPCRPPMHWDYGASVSYTWHVSAGGYCQALNTYPEDISEIKIVSRSSHGTVTKDRTFGIAYHADPDFKGSDKFIYAVVSKNDGKHHGKVATITVSVLVE